MLSTILKCFFNSTSPEPSKPHSLHLVHYASALIKKSFKVKVCDLFYIFNSCNCWNDFRSFWKQVRKQVDFIKPAICTIRFPWVELIMKAGLTSCRYSSSSEDDILTWLILCTVSYINCRCAFLFQKGS